ncbi:hypothetical protein OESDEN_23817 [Oesophagostomum dentatum]|uniref:BTB domain-containing protein n=1 Tax=Oesophagostomum dentatum TaxID=61180 RepID=A0A0B1RTZ4_OESDE|nr:hypothetical protein OESDEN_23817 [Oesophagostomum dentatum]
MSEEIVVSKSCYDDFAVATPWRNFEVIVEERSFFVNAGWLAELSPFFADYCFGEDAHRSLIIDDIKPSDMLEFFRCIFFCPMRKPISGEFWYTLNDQISINIVPTNVIYILFNRADF